MKNGAIKIIIMITGIITINACAHNQTTNIAYNLDVPALYSIYSTGIKDLAMQSKCSSPPSIKLINNDKRRNELVILKIIGHTHYVIPAELNDSIVKYIGDVYEINKVKVNSSSDKVMEVSIKNLEFNIYAFPMRALVELNVDIPEIKYSKVFTVEEKSARPLYVASAFAIHLATLQIIEDPLIQGYVLCR